MIGSAVRPFLIANESQQKRADTYDELHKHRNRYQSIYSNASASSN